MKTYTGKNISKKEIQKTLRTMDSTKIFWLHHQIFGNSDRCKVMDFIESYAPSNKVKREAYHIAFNNKHAEYRGNIMLACIKKHGFFHGDDRKNVVDMLKDECTRFRDNYSKRPMMGRTHLYFCHPVYGFSDYNKRRMIAIEGNERFCELVIRYANKHF